MCHRHPLKGRSVPRQEALQHTPTLTLAIVWAIGPARARTTAVPRIDSGLLNLRAGDHNRDKREAGLVSAYDEDGLPRVERLPAGPNGLALAGQDGCVRLENSFIGAEGVGTVTERSLWEAGVTHWDDFDGRAVGPTRAENIESFLGTARERLARKDASFFVDALPDSERWRLYENFREDACFLDIETTGLSPERHEVTTVSIHRNSETTTLVRGDTLCADTLSAYLDPAPLVITYNGSRFDLPFLESAFDLDLNIPHLDAMGVCHALDLTGGLDAAERALDVNRERPDISGRDAVRLWREYEAGRDGALETLIAYNQEDTENLRAVLDSAVARLEADVFPGI